MEEPARRYGRRLEGMPSGGAGLVLGSGGARGAYELGVARYLFEGLPRELGRVPDFRYFSGTSAGAVNASALAAFADRPLDGVAVVGRRWAELELAKMIRPSRWELLRLSRLFFLMMGRPRLSRLMDVGEPRGGLLDPRPFRQVLLDALPFDRIDAHLRTGALEALTLSATEVASGRTVVFVRAREATPRLPQNRTTVVLSEAALRPEHALASSAIPLLFAPVSIEGRLYCDGSLRQSVPLSPAHHLGADRIVVVNTQHCPARVPPWLAHERGQAVASPFYVLGKTINALTLDRVEDDIERLQLVNGIIEAGARAYGADFLPRLNQELERTARRTIRPVRVVVVRPSESLGRLAAEYVRSRGFRQSTKGPVGRLFQGIADEDAEREADLLSYLLFDGPFCAELMALGYADARAQRDELGALFTPERDEKAVTAPTITEEALRSN